MDTEALKNLSDQATRVLPKLNVVMIDNYDSFTYNLVQYLQMLGLNVETLRNDALSAKEALALKPDFFVLSPGPSSPDQAGVCLELLREAAAEKIPLLGVCLGHQAIGQAFGGKVIKAPEPVHGKTAQLKHSGQGVFQGLANPVQVTRYHSLIVEKKSLPPVFDITAETEDGLIMGLRHKTLPIEGIQFHPESVLTESGLRMLENFAASVVRT